MSDLEKYEENEKNNRFEEIMSKEYLTQSEYDFCFGWDKSIREDTSYIGDYSKYGDYLNFRVYSEQEHDEFQLKMEQGV